MDKITKELVKKTLGIVLITEVIILSISLVIKIAGGSFLDPFIDLNIVVSILAVVVILIYLIINYFIL